MCELCLCKLGKRKKAEWVGWVGVGERWVDINLTAQPEVTLKPGKWAREGRDWGGVCKIPQTNSVFFFPTFKLPLHPPPRPPPHHAPSPFPTLIAELYDYHRPHCPDSNWVQTIPNSKDALQASSRASRVLWFEPNTSLVLGVCVTSRRKAYNGWLLHPAHWGHSGSGGYRTGIFCPLTSSAHSGGLVAARLESSLCWFLGGLGLAHAGFCLSSRKKKKRKVSVVIWLRSSCRVLLWFRRRIALI